ncbi:MAG: T9SS type A sorting domain-containing protein [Candidatus Marinimicrobia bacterium]|nr:T9SS type A sorting domain-containing protein [Candidatus Neomarinimicrobiota bacterium]
MRKFLLTIFLGIIYPQTNIDSLYHSYDDIRNQLFIWNEEFGDSNHPFYNSVVFQLDSIGVSSNEELPIYAVKLSLNANQKEDQPRILILGQCHAEEILGVEMSMSLIDWLLHPTETPWGNYELPMFMHNLEIWIVPTHNPEGLRVVHGYEENGIWIQDESYRKNKTDVNENGIFDFIPFHFQSIAGADSDGVDLNRNYELNWEGGDDKYELNLQSCGSNQTYSSNYDYYRGASPFSEAETQTIRDFVIEKEFLISVAYHSSRSGCVSERVIYPWAWNWQDDNFNEIVDEGEANTSPNFEVIRKLATNVASEIGKEGGGYYNPRPQKSMNGNAHDWIYAETGCIQLLIEMGSSNMQPMEQGLIDDIIENNRKGLFYLFGEAISEEAKDTRQISGIITDAVSGGILENVEVKILEIHSEIFKPRLTDAFGRFRRLVPPVSLKMEFSAAGYTTQTFEIGGDVDTLNVALSPSLAINNSDIPQSYKLNQNYPNPFNPSTTIGFYLSNPEKVLLRIFDINGKLIKTIIDNQIIQSGHHEYILQSQNLDLSSSIYMYTIETKSWNSTKKMLLLK